MGVPAGQRAVTQPFLSCQRAPCSRPQLPLATLDSQADRFQFSPGPVVTAPVTPDSLALLPCHPRVSHTIDISPYWLMTPLTCHPRPLSLLPSQGSPPQHPALPKSGSILHSPNLAVAALCVLPPSPEQALGTLPVPGCPHGVWAERGCHAGVRGHRMAASRQGRKRLRSHCGCSLRFPRWQQRQPGVASHARPRAWLPPLPPATTGPSRPPRASQHCAGVARCPSDRAAERDPLLVSPKLSTVSHRHVSHVPGQA